MRINDAASVSIVDTQSTNTRPIKCSPSRQRIKVACVAHFIDAVDIVHWDPAIGKLDSQAAESLLNKAYNVVDPFVTQSLLIEGDNHDVEMKIYGIPVSTAGLVHRMKMGRSSELLDLVRNCVDQAIDWGAQLVGFAGHTSIITNNCQLLDYPEVGLTSGNSLTAAAAIEAIYQSHRKNNIQLRNSKLGVVGAVGNIGEIIATILANDVEHIRLFGTTRSKRRLDQLKSKLLLLHNGPTISVESDLTELSHCNIIFSATNAPTPILSRGMIAKTPVTICDIAVPGDVDQKAIDTNVTLIRGGLISLPDYQKVKLLGSGLCDGELWACVAEVLLLGLEGETDDYSIGALEAEKVTGILEIARRHNFNLEPRTVDHAKLLGYKKRLKDRVS